MINYKKSNKIYKRKVLRLSALFLVCSGFLFSCKKEKTDLGDSLQSESLNVVTLDTFTLITSSELISDMPSDETTVNLLGAYNDPVFGGVDCGIVTQLRLSSAAPSLGSSGTTVIDSLILSLKFTGIEFYANLGDVTLEVFEINDVLVRGTDASPQDYYTHQEPTITGSNLILSGFETFTPNIFSTVMVGQDTALPPQLRIPLDLALGDKLVALNDAGNMSSDDTFINSFKGLYVKANMPGLAPGQGTVLYFSLESIYSKMVLYFHTDTDPTIQEYPFLINSSAARYNRITFDRTETAVQKLLDDPSANTENFYLQGSSVRGTIEFPNLLGLNYDSLGNYKPKIINSAKLILPIQDYQSDPFDPSTALFLARTVDSKISTFVIDYFGLTKNTENYNEETRSFTFTMTREIQNILNGKIENSAYRVYSPSFFGSTVERIVFNGAGSLLKDRPRLEITYTDY